VFEKLKNVSKGDKIESNDKLNLFRHSPADVRIPIEKETNEQIGSPSTYSEDKGNDEKKA
jgi:hypothetical protein